MTNLCGDFGSLSPIWSTLKGLPSSILLHGFGWGVVGALPQLNFSLCPLSTRWSNMLHVNLHLRIWFPENTVYGTVCFFFCKIYIDTKQKNQLSLKSIFIHENLGKLLLLLYNFSIASWKTRNYWTCVSYVFLTLWSKTVRKKVQPNLWPRANSNLVLFSLTEPQNKRTPDLPEEEFEKEEIKENEAAVKKRLVEATREFEEIVVCCCCCC